MDFPALKHSCYHRIACGPFDGETSVLIGSDIVLHLPVLEYFASLSETVVEFGVRDGQSTVALISGCRGIVHSFDIRMSGVVNDLRALELPCKWTFQTLDTGSELESGLVPECDMLFIDTEHTHQQMSKELLLHGRKAMKFLAFHDTFTFRDEICPAIEDFVASHPGEYRELYRTDCNNGLLILERIGWPHEATEGAPL